MGKGDSLADLLFNETSLHLLADGFERAGVFSAKPFVSQTLKAFPTLALKARINHIAEHLSKSLPSDFLAAKEAIEAAMPAPLDPTKTDNDFGHFIYAPLGIYVENHGLVGHFESSLDLLEQITQRFSMEFSLRAFLNHDAAATLARAKAWTLHESYHVRRLASEGTRPKLPWGQNVGLSVQDTLPILDALHNDPTRFVTRSVANHLNDITKDDPSAVIERLTNWQKTAKQSAPELTWMRKHALRTLVKSGHAGAMTHLGYTPDVAINAAKINIPNEIAFGDKPIIACEFTPETDAPLIVDYVIDFMKSNGKTAPKTFKMKVLDGKANKTIQLEKAHHFDNTATTFKLYAGAHKIHLQINGRIVASQAFSLS
ncbi:DNA alkylation repair protein [Yoonia sp.]|nr:DNA alkylation repair protein [Yoonia sp.]